MSTSQLILALAMGGVITAASAATPNAASDSSARLPAGDNVQAQTQAKVRKPAPRPLSSKRRHPSAHNDHAASQ